MNLRRRSPAHVLYSLACCGHEHHCTISFLANLEKEGQGRLMDELAETFMFGDVAYINLRGDRVDRRVPLSVKAERLLEVTQHQRYLQYERLRAAGDPRTREHNLESFWFNAGDMEEIFNTWRNDYENWMLADSIPEYERLWWGNQRQAAHQFAKPRFAAYKFQLFGSPLLTHSFIELPLCSAEQPANIIG